MGEQDVLEAKRLRHAARQVFDTQREMVRADLDAAGVGKRVTTKLVTEGKTIAGFGAPAKATTLMYQFGIGPETIDFIVDDSPLKQGLYTPGTHISVLPPDALYERRPDYVIILAWNFAEQIMDKQYAFLEAGGRFIVPLPTLEIL